MLELVDKAMISPAGSLIPSNDRKGQGGPKLDLPPGTMVFSADGHIDVSVDIFQQRFPASMKDRAPRVWFADGVWHIGADGKSYLPYEFVAPIAQYDGLPGAASGNLPARLADADADGVDAELAFPNNMLVLLGHPDHDLRETAFRVYNEHLAELQEAAPGRFYGVGMINWWDPAGARRTLAEAKALGLKTFLLPANPFTRPDGSAIDWGSAAMIPLWEEIADAGLPVSHHIGESPKHCEYNPIAIGLLHNMASFREMFGKYIFGGILDRHPSLRVGWFEGGINWVAAALQDAEHIDLSIRHMHNWKLEHPVRHYWDRHMVSSFMVDPLGLELIDRIGADKALWSSDYPHSESTFGYTKSAIRQVIEMVGPERAPGILGGNLKRHLGLD
jgi:predicted TIM-barrel fold metal-dependent hydrolase